MAAVFKTGNQKSPSIEKNLIPGYTLEIDCADREMWNSCLTLFDDASMYQTWPYGSVSWGEDSLSHLVLKKGKKIVAASQARIVSLPRAGIGIAFVRWGPMWMLKNTKPDIDAFQSILHSLRHEYVVKRGLVLRIIPHVSHARDMLVPFRYYLEEYRLGSHLPPYRSIIVNLDVTVETLRKGLTHRARNHLVRAEKRDFEVVQGTGDDLFGIFLDLYRQTLDRKRFARFVSPDDFREIQKILPDEHKMQIMVCRYGGTPCSALICSPMGDMGINLLSANSNYMVESNLGSSYLLFWKMALWLKENNYTLYDLGGIDPFENPGTYRFKKNFMGTNGNPVWNIGQFDCWSNPVIYTGIRLGDLFRSTYKSTKKTLIKWQSPKKTSPTP